MQKKEWRQQERQNIYIKIIIDRIKLWLTIFPRISLVYYRCKIKACNRVKEKGRNLPLCTGDFYYNLKNPLLKETKYTNTHS